MSDQSCLRRRTHDCYLSYAKRKVSEFYRRCRLVVQMILNSECLKEARTYAVVITGQNFANRNIYKKNVLQGLN